MTVLGPQEPPWNDVAAVAVTGQPAVVNVGEVSVPTSEGELLLSFHETGVRLRLGEPDFSSYEMLESEPSNLPVTITPEDDHTLVEGGDHTLKLFHDPMFFELFKGARRVQCSPTDSHFVRRFRLPPFARVAQGWLLSFELDAGEPVYGLGEKWGSLDKRGQLVRSYNHDALGVNAEISYKNVPFCWSPRGWGAFVHTPAPVTHAVGYAPWSNRAYAMLVEDAAVDLFLFSGDDAEKMIFDYTQLVGRAPVPPLWSLGVILSKAYYVDAEDLLATAREVRERGMPCDVITLDGRAWQDTQKRFDFQWDASRYPDPAAVVDELKALDFKICVWEYPLVSVENPLFEEMAGKGWLLKDVNSGEAYRYAWDRSPFGEVLTPLPDSGIVDFTHPEAYAFWRDSHKPLFDLGVDMIKADFGEQVSDDMVAHNGATGQQLHNSYAMLYNRCVYEAAQRYCKSGPFLFSRSAWTGSQRYPAQWGGDPQADWGGLAASLRGGLSWGLSGAPFYATDIGGFYADQRDPELYVRWLQAALFSAHFRLHGIGLREPWSYGEAANKAASQALKLRYQLIPYLYSCMSTAHSTGMPVQRPMVLACPNERQSWAFEHQFMLGDDMLVAPCLGPGGRVECYLPKGNWLRFPSGELHPGGDTCQLELALDEMAVFVREGATIPLGPDLQFIGSGDEASPVQEHWPGN